SSLLASFSHHLATPDLYTLSLHDALPISGGWKASRRPVSRKGRGFCPWRWPSGSRRPWPWRWRKGRAPPPGGSRRWRGRRARQKSEEHTSELQSRENLVCRLLLEKKNIAQ